MVRQTPASAATSRAVVRSAARSEPASGSLSAKAAIFSPVATARRYWSCCAGVPASVQRVYSSGIAGEVPVDQARAGHEAETINMSGPGEEVAEVRDLSIEEPDIESIVREIYGRGAE